MPRSPVDPGAAIRIRPPGRRLIARVLDACRTACEAGDLDAATRLLRLGETLLGPRPDPLTASIGRGRGRPPRRHLTDWNEDAEVIVALHAAVWRLRAQQQQQQKPRQAPACDADVAASPAASPTALCLEL